ncbi:hypothetical protein [Dellaglioa carnosa]|uniref:Uncharacterized protein n=1 Tax=Dellaglioa carnosa TaxID=2995136 RepID=A0ABT4JN82_9LACO|nr:hypothetical protein [Dellaglioa carnosa]MCZ2491674.1 hypothetical protein [Dellaglioa carnosa]MCZ2494751.1 hypothetical protein [Dellaglioa carnosa]MDK1731590.1 hypothetical protein [Dellaglioa carnosa]
MKKICFVLTVSSGINFGSIDVIPFIKNHDDLKDYFSKYYDVSVNYLKDKDSVDYLVVPEPFMPFDNENNLPIIEVPARLFIEKDFDKIKMYLDDYIS